MFYKKIQIQDKKSFNEFTHQKIETQDTSLDSLVQICNILPDSKGKRKDQLLKNKSKFNQNNYTKTFLHKPEEYQT